jgi:hypothetical protein
VAGLVFFSAITLLLLVQFPASFPGAVWTALYLTPLDAAVLAAGCLLLTLRMARGRIPAWSRAHPFPVLAALAAGACLYLAVFHHYYSVQDVIPLYLWGARRLVPVVLPLVAVLEAAALAALAGCAPRRWQAAALGAALVLLAAARLPDLMLLRQHREYEGSLAAVAAIAGRTEPDAVFLLDGDDTGIRFGAPLAYLHGRPAYLLWPGVAPDGARDLVAAAGAASRPVYYLGSRLPSGIGGRDLAPVGRWRFQFPELERTSAGRPARWNTYTAEVGLYRLGP